MTGIGGETCRSELSDLGQLCTGAVIPRGRWLNYLRVSKSIRLGICSRHRLREISLNMDASQL